MNGLDATAADVQVQPPAGSLTAADRERILRGFNDTAAAYPHDQPLHCLIEAQASRSPDALAVTCSAQSLTYAELNARANQLARWLRKRGVGPDKLVGLCVVRGVEMLVGMLGVLKAGGAYVPLDPGNPAERLQHLLADAKPEILLTLAALKRALPPLSPEVIALDTHWSVIARESCSDLAPGAVGVLSSHLAYVIYTSGSTGRPKGVMVEHRNIVNYAVHAARQLDIAAGEGSLICTSPSFDLMLTGLYPTLLCGKTVRLCPERPGLPDLSGELLHCENLAPLKLTPSHLGLLEPALVAGQLANRVRVLVLGGEPLQASAVRLWRQHAPGTRIFNHYGPTEATVGCVVHEVGDQGRGAVPIGRPISNTTLYILDPHLQPVPVGVPGELHIGGAGVARGYLNRPNLTAERFIMDPFGSDPRGRLYKTGDLARWRSDGQVEYLGRGDQQIKIRGHRIEPGEIEAHLARHEQVKECVVLAREDVPGEKRLVAYMTRRHESGANIEELRAHLKAVLPEYMVPSAFVVLERLPLTPNGKLDRRALPVPSLEAYSTREYEAPQGELEQGLAEIWARLLRLERVGRRDNFFELGGHSLLIVQLKDQLRSAGLSVEVSRVYDSPTLADLALALRPATAAPLEVPASLIPPGCELITPRMLPLVELEPEQIARIVQTVPGGARNLQDIYPLAPLQEGILFHHFLAGQGGDTYVLPMLLSMSSRERADDFIRELQRVIDRHDILRTAVLWEGLPRPLQVVYRQATLPVAELVLDWNRDPLEQLRERMKPEHQKLELRQAPLLRLQLAADERRGQWYALLQLHHIASDHIARAILLEEVSACLEGRAEELPAPVPYRRHVAQTLADAKAHDAERFFRTKLGDLIEPTTPFDLVDAQGDGSRVEEARQALDSTLARRIRTQAQRLSVSAATLFHAAWALVVSCTSSRDDVVFGSLLSGRLQGNGGAQRILGMFINTLPLRIRLEDVTAAGLVDQVRQELVELLSHEQASLAVAQRCSAMTTGMPLFSTLLNYLHGPPTTGTAQRLTTGIRLLEVREWTNYPIVLSVNDLGDGFVLTAQTDRRIEPQRITEYLRTAVHSLVAALEEAPQTPALALPVLGASERQQILGQFNATHADYPHERLTHELFEEQVLRTPDAVAVICGDQELSYDQLNRKANRLAHLLVRRGVRPDERVALCVERGLDLVVGLLGILKAGGAYVPLDVTYPAERLEYMLRDSAPVVLLTQERLKGTLPASAAQVLTLDTGSDEIESAPDSNLSVATAGVGPNNLAYVIYTSGSTGTPKGVMVEHRNLLNLVGWHCAAFDVTPGCRCSSVAAVGFDAAGWEIWPPLSAGATLVLASSAVARDPAALLDWWANEPLDVAFLPTPMAEFLFSRQIENRRLRTLLVGGDRLRHRPAALRFELINNYGPTECTVVATSGAIRATDALLHIGRPVANTCLYILDRHHRPVPVGTSGEIYIGGAGVARGYLGREQLTRERFLPDPFSTSPNARMYRSGDLARWQPDGTIEFLGRNDQQVKIRGYRIELEEIEARLASHERVRDTVVVAREDVPGERSLVAYITVRAGETPRAAELRAHLLAVLPEYMVPSAFVTLEKLPLTPNGKLDRRALPAPELTAYATRQYEAPEGEIEALLAGIWQDLLRVERVGRQDHFFELGGHSLLIVQLMERLRRVGLTITVREVFASPKLANLASALAARTAELFIAPPNRIPPGCELITPQMLPLIALEPEHIERIVRTAPGGARDIQDIYPLAPLQEGILFHHLLDRDGGDTYVLPMLLSLSSREKLDDLIRALQKVIDRHDALRTAVLWEQLPRPVQVVYRRVALPVTELVLEESRDPVEQLEERMKPEYQKLDLRQPPLMRLHVARDAREGRWLALLQLHHLVCDNRSLDILLAEVMTYVSDSARELPAPGAYRNHVAQALEHAKAHDAEEFFRRKLADVDEPTAPFGLLDTQGDGGRIEQVRRTLDPALARRIRIQARRVGVGAATLFHAAWALVIARTTGRDDVVFGSVLLGRLQGSAGAQRILGMFINTLPLRLTLRDLTVKDLVESTQRELVELLGHEQTPLAVAQRCSGLSGSAPLFTALLNYRHGALDVESGFAAASGVRLLAMRSWTNYPIMLSVDDPGEGFVLVMDTDRKLDPLRLMGYTETGLRSLVEALEAAPQAPALTLSILTEHERRRLLESFNATHVDYASGKTVHELFEEQARRTPDAPAVMDDVERLTYRELNRQANQLARYLKAQGVGTADLVGICHERGVRMVVALLGALKVGAAYVPLDPNYPPERLRHMLEDANPRVVLTQEALRPLLPGTRSEVLTLDTTWREIAGRLDEDLAPADIGLTPQHLVYVIYTSGSTGQPKGIAMQHRSMVNLIEWHRTGVLDCSGQRVLQFAALSFDVAFQEIFSTLCGGGTLMLVDEWLRRDARALLQFLNSRAIHRIFVPPLMLQSLAECFATTGECPMSLRDVITAGEQLHVTAEVASFLGHLEGCRLHNHYGPTETHVVTALTLTGSTTAWPALPTIGRPVANTAIHVLHQQHQLAPIGVTGEIHIAGAAVARGYLGRPELTAQRFIEDPFCGKPGASMYRTGDLGRWREDGTLEYLGRNDAQVKIRGYRIELGEIEVRLAQHELVGEAVVVAREDVIGPKRLVAYVKRRAHQTPSSEELQAHLKSSLPEHMVPRAFVVLDKFPLTPNGKLDRRALPAPELGAYASRPYEPPQGPMEDIVTRIWQELLRVERVGREDNFFELGGHSLLAMQVQVRIRAALSIDIPMRALFKCRTLRSLAAELNEQRQARLLAELADGGTEIDALLEQLSALPEDRVQDMVHELRLEARS